MLDKLQTLHLELLDAIAVLDRFAKSDCVQLEQLALARYNASKASRRRTQCLDTEIVPHLLVSATADERAAILSLHAISSAQMEASRTHVAKWNIDRIAAHWPDYCREGKDIRAKMRARIEEERKILYPLLAAKVRTPELRTVRAATGFTLPQAPRLAW